MSKKYSEMSELGYNMEVIKKLKSQGKIGIVKKTGLQLASVLGTNPVVNYKLVKKGNQYGVFSTIAHKVKGSQYNILGIQIAKKIRENQVQLWKGLQIAEEVGENQIQILGLQMAKKVGRNQIQGMGGLQIAEEVGENQDQRIGLVQGAKKIKGGQLQGIGLVQGAVEIGKDQVQGIGLVQGAKKVGGDQGHLFTLYSFVKTIGGAKSNDLWQEIKEKLRTILN